MRDDLDGFEMKPITQGLGFQNKKDSFKKSMNKVVKNEIQGEVPVTRPDGLLEVPKARNSAEIVGEIKQALRPFNDNKQTVQMTETLPTVDSPEMPMPEPARTPVKEDPLNKIDFRIPQKDLDAANATKRGASDALIKEWVPVSFSVLAAFLDGVMILALSMIFLVGLISATNVDLISVMLSAKADLPAQISLVILYLAMSQMYLIISRSFAGASIGEWTFDIQLGRPEDVPKATYPIKVLFRSVVTLLTGVFLLPFLSLIFRRDLAGVIAGVRLYRRNV